MAVPHIWKQAFIAQLADCGNVRQACKDAGVHYTTVYDARKADPNFAAQWDAAIQEACDLLENEAWRRAHEGTDEPQFYKGKVCGTVRRYSDVLLIFLLKAYRPELFREKVYLSTEQMERMYQQELARMRGEASSEGNHDLTEGVEH